MTSEQIITVLRKEYEKTGLSRRKFAAKVGGVSDVTVRNTLDGLNSPLLPTVIDICTALGYEVNIVKSKNK